MSLLGYGTLEQHIKRPATLFSAIYNIKAFKGYILGMSFV
jgi:hypothetical protein